MNKRQRNKRKKRELELIAQTLNHIAGAVEKAADNVGYYMSQLTEDKPELKSWRDGYVDGTNNMAQSVRTVVDNFIEEVNND
ncbi:hypothetical protein [Streptococcus plurextorum]|uniref:hypothetical protein n=1 Tax=Streptococcus plurextorum TaxID=456876 RepID=UPI00041443F8|nr:hypothetical protein [Streptococcus plurextorum]